MILCNNKGADQTSWMRMLVCAFVFSHKPPQTKAHVVLPIYPFMPDPFMPNGVSHCYELDESISNFRVVGGIFHFNSNFKRNFCKQTVENLIRRRILRRLIWFCTVCRCPTKRALDLYGLRKINIPYSLNVLTYKCVGYLFSCFFCLGLASHTRR